MIDIGKVRIALLWMIREYQPISIRKIFDLVNDVWSAIYHAELCIVDCTGRNPNVFYELGIAHTLGRKAILITQDLDDNPFDVSHIRTITYSATPDGLCEFEAILKRTIQQELGLDNVS